MSTTPLLQQSILQLCSDHIAYGHQLQILGIICIKIDDQPTDMVIKLNNTLKRAPPLQATIPHSQCRRASRPLSAAAQQSQAKIIANHQQIMNVSPQVFPNPYNNQIFHRPQNLQYLVPTQKQDKDIAGIYRKDEPVDVEPVRTVENSEGKTSGRKNRKPTKVIQVYSHEDSLNESEDEDEDDEMELIPSLVNHDSESDVDDALIIDVPSCVNEAASNGSLDGLNPIDDPSPLDSLRSDTNGPPLGDNAPQQTLVANDRANIRALLQAQAQRRQKAKVEQGFINIAGTSSSIQLLHTPQEEAIDFSTAGRQGERQSSSADSLSLSISPLKPIKDEPEDDGDSLTSHILPTSSRFISQAVFSNTSFLKPPFYHPLLSPSLPLTNGYHPPNQGVLTTGAMLSQALSQSSLIRISPSADPKSSFQSSPAFMRKQPLLPSTMNQVSYSNFTSYSDASSSSRKRASSSTHGDDFVLEKSGLEKKRRRRAPDETLTAEEIAEYMGAAGNCGAGSSFKCKYCSLEINDLVQYLQHTLTVHNAYICHQCGKSFTTKSSLLRHRPIHTGQRRYACSVCKKTFYRKDKCKSHIKRHLGPGEQNLDQSDQIETIHEGDF